MCTSSQSHPSPHLPKLLPSIINDLSGPGDMVVCLGAGNITQIANALPEKLRMLRYGTDGADE